jgi:hypothetical protein
MFNFFSKRRNLIFVQYILSAQSISEQSVCCLFLRKALFIVLMESNLQERRLLFLVFRNNKAIVFKNLLFY